MISEYHDDTRSTSGTYLHPKTYNSAKYENTMSEPVVVYDAMEIMAYSFVFKLNILKRNKI